ncbi:NEDD8-specific protease [Lachnellula suecica]|uniref:NEDD8-specific protease n=1 Tax=Lachnellula suecica TaxID=602035 RepID=A0A8T9C154_9HELO|nr:NEDD8-specific protease [Lachnellula suecica]
MTRSRDRLQKQKPPADPDLHPSFPLESTRSSPTTNTPREREAEMGSRSGFHPFKGRVSRHFGDSLAPDDAYLSFTKEDIDTLKNDWLTDNTIAFWEEYLEREELRKYPSSHIVLLRPSMAFMLMKTPNVLSLREALPNFTSTTHIFLPINDARNVSVAEGGSHWSLLLVSIIDGVAFHYDSLSPSNYNEAMLATQKISELLGRPLRFMNLEDSPQQENGSDCGVYVCIQMRHLLLKRLLSANAREKVSMSMGGKLVDAAGGRKEMLRTIEGFRKEGERRRSHEGSRSTSPFAKGKSGESRSPPRIDS